MTHEPRKHTQLIKIVLRLIDRERKTQDLLTSGELVAPTELDDGDELLLLSLTATNVSIGNLLTFSTKEEVFTKFIYEVKEKR